MSTDLISDGNKITCCVSRDAVFKRRNSGHKSNDFGTFTTDAISVFGSTDGLVKDRFRD